MSMAEDPLVDCPLDNVHRIRTSRLQFHLVRCLKNHDLSLSSKVKCPFNPLHIIEAVEVLHHCRSCRDSASIILDQYDLEGEKCFSGLIDFEEMQRQYNANLPKNYEQETRAISSTAGYNPNENIENKMVYRSLNCASKAKRKEFRLRERQRFAALEQNQKSSQQTSESVVSKEQKPLRQPFDVPNVLKENSVNTDSTTLSTGQMSEKSNHDQKIKSVLKSNEGDDGKNSAPEFKKNTEQVIESLSKMDIGKDKNISDNKTTLVDPSNKHTSGKVISYAAMAKSTISDDGSDKNLFQSRTKQNCAANFDVNSEIPTAAARPLRLPHSVAKKRSGN